METSQDFTIEFKDYGLITVPKGTKLTHMTASGVDNKYHFVNEFEWVRKNYPEHHPLTLMFDIVHYGIDIPVEFVINK